MAIFTMDQRKEQRVCIKFCANLGKSATETLEMIQQGFGDQSLSHAQVFQWHARFKADRTSVDDDERTGRPTSCTTPETVALIQELIRQDRRLTIRDIAEEVKVGYGTCQRVLTEELGMHRVAAKFVPRILTADQKQQRVNICTELRQLAFNDETFLCRVITGDESWVYGYDPETKRQSSQWKSPTSPRPKKGQTGEKQSQEHDHHFI
jgi:histone-lysine N-methyltransferase SETMAR